MVVDCFFWEDLLQWQQERSESCTTARRNGSLLGVRTKATKFYEKRMFFFRITCKKGDNGALLAIELLH